MGSFDPRICLCLKSANAATGTTGPLEHGHVTAMSDIAFEISNREIVARDTRFADVGLYERVGARATLHVDPNAAHNAAVVDLDQAPTHADGRVTLSTDVQILKPVDTGRANRRLFIELCNRGNKRCLQFFNDAPATNDPRQDADFGNGFLMRRGYTLCWIAWQGDILRGNGRITMDLPIAGQRDVPITGWVRSEFIPGADGQTTYPLSSWISTRSHPAVSLDTTSAALTRRRYPDDTPEPIPPDQWMFARTEGGRGLDNQGAETAIVASDTHIHMPSGFKPGWIYELLYEARDPLVLGLGHVAVRDVTSFLRNDPADRNGSPNPLIGADGSASIEKVYAWGRSQTGRYLRDFVHHGFNCDTQGRRVFDGILPHVSGGGLMWLNHRFANAVRPAGQEYEDCLTPADRFPFSYAQSTDHLTGQTDAILKRPATDPLVMHSQSATEYWQRRGSLVHTTTNGQDLEQPETVRVYLWASSQHFADPRLRDAANSVCRERINVVATSMLFRALLDAMDAWASDGTPPPASRMPRQADGTLINGAQWHAQFPAIPGVMVPKGPAGLPLIDWGPDASGGRLREPPSLDREQVYVVQVPSVDHDGNDLAGVRAPMVQVPLATYTGWNIRKRGFGHGAMHEFSGSTLPFPETESERQQTRDPRPSIAARYRDLDAYLAQIRQAAQELVADRLMLEEDVERCIETARNWARLQADVSWL